MANISDFANAIAQMEGAKGELNNPGNIRNWSSNLPTSSNGFTIFPSLNDGWNALQTQIKKNINRGLTLVEFFGGKPGVYGGYAPGSDNNDPNGYANFVAGKLGISPNTPLNQINWDDTNDTSVVSAGNGIDTSVVDDFSTIDSIDSIPLVVLGIGLIAAIVIFK